MTSQGKEISADWRDEKFVETWTSGDNLSHLLEFPRKMAARVVAAESPAVEVVVDIGSGPGGFLATFLRTFPSAEGIWADASEAMLAAARERLTEFEGRVTYLLMDMTDLSAAGLSRGVDVILTSRTSHHLDQSGLARFYQDAAAHLDRGGWLINLDHVSLPGPWHERMRAVRRQLIGTKKEGRLTHHHIGPPPTIRDHLDSYSSAGMTDVEIPWRAFYTCLFMGRMST